MLESYVITWHFRNVADSDDKTKYILMGCGIAVLIGVCGVGSCFALFGGAAFLGYQKLDVPAQQCKGLLLDVRENRLPDAYARMSDEYQKQVPLASFESAVRGRPPLVQAVDDTIAQRQVINGAAIMGGFLSLPTGNVPVMCELREYGGTWRVDTLLLDEDPVR